MTVNKAGNYTQPTKRKQIFNRIKAANTHGTAAGKWSARKAQALAKAYKKAEYKIRLLERKNYWREKYRHG